MDPFGSLKFEGCVSVAEGTGSLVSVAGETGATHNTVSYHFT